MRRRPPYPRSPYKASGTFDFFTNVIVGTTGASRSDYVASEDDLIITDTVSNDELALGYVGYDHFEKHRTRLKSVPIDDGDDSIGIGPVEPSALNVRRGVYRPLSRPLFIYVNAESLLRPELDRFVARYLRQAETFTVRAGAIPLRAREYELVNTRFSLLTKGSAFMQADAVGANIERVLEGAFTTALHRRATVENVTSRRLMLDMDLTLRRAHETRRWVLKTDTAGWLYRRVNGGQEIAGDVADYPAAVAKRLEWETEIARSRVEGWH